jgi:hypothetical protein
VGYWSIQDCGCVEWMQRNEYEVMKGPADRVDPPRSTKPH